MRHEYFSVYTLKNKTLNGEQITCDQLSVGDISVGGGGYVSKEKAFLNVSGSFNLFTVTGTVRMRILPVVTVDLLGTNALLSIGRPGTLNSLIANTTCTALDAGEIWFSATAATNVRQMAVSRMLDVVMNQNVKGNVTAVKTTGGTMVFHCWWEPITDGAEVTAAT